MCMRRFAARYHQTISQDDDGGQMTVRGQHREIYTYDDEYHMAALIDGGMANEWKWIKKKLKAAGCLILEDGETGGLAVFDLANTKAAWAAIRVVKPVAGGAIRPMSRPLPQGASRSLFPDWDC
jgi:hypothetical protein